MTSQISPKRSSGHPPKGVVSRIDRPSARLAFFHRGAEGIGKSALPDGKDTPILQDARRESWGHRHFREAIGACCQAGGDE